MCIYIFIYRKRELLLRYKYINFKGDIMESKANRKKFVRYKEGAELYSICQSKFEKLAKEAKAIYKVDKVVLVNCDLFEKYLETFRVDS